MNRRFRRITRRVIARASRVEGRDMATIEERRAWRDAFLITLYNEVGDNLLEWREFQEIAEKAGIPAEEAESVATWNVNEGRAKWPVMGGLIGLTQLGVSIAERLLSNGATAPLALYLSIDEKKELESVVSTIARARDAGELYDVTGDDAVQLDADLRTLELQVRAPRPSRELVKGALRSLGTVLAGAAGSALFFGIQELIKRL
jgi:hypothetical protein